MTVYIYGDVTIDNLEYSGTYPSPFANQEGRPDSISELSRAGFSTQRIVARSFGGAYLLARHFAVALALWRHASNEQPDDTLGLSELAPWSDILETLNLLTEDSIKNPHKYMNYLNLYCRLQMSTDKKCRITRNGFEGYTLPQTKNEQESYLHTLSGAESNSHIEFDQENSSVDLVLLNDGGIRINTKLDDFISKEMDPSKNLAGRTVI